MLKRRNINVTGQDVSFVTHSQFNGSDGVKDALKKLIMMHWLNALPLCWAED